MRTSALTVSRSFNSLIPVDPLRNLEGRDHFGHARHFHFHQFAVGVLDDLPLVDLFDFPRSLDELLKNPSLTPATTNRRFGQQAP